MHKDVAKALEAAETQVLNQFLGGSSGLDELAEAIAKDHTTVAIQTFLRNLPNSTNTEHGVSLWYPTRILVELTEEEGPLEKLAAEGQKIGYEG